MRWPFGANVRSLHLTRGVSVGLALNREPLKVTLEGTPAPATGVLARSGASASAKGRGRLQATQESCVEGRGGRYPACSSAPPASASPSAETTRRASGRVGRRGWAGAHPRRHREGCRQVPPRAACRQPSSPSAPRVIRLHFPGQTGFLPQPLPSPPTGSHHSSLN